MHIKKNMFENIFNMVTDVKEKTRDNIKTRKYIPLFFYHKNMKLIYDMSRVTKPKVIFSLDNNVLWICFISKLVNLMDDRFNEIKSHDCHMFMQTPIPLVC